LIRTARSAADRSSGTPGQEHGELAEFLQLHAANIAAHEMLANLRAFFDARRARHHIIKIARELWFLPFGTS